MSLKINNQKSLRVVLMLNCFLTTERKYMQVPPVIFYGKCGFLRLAAGKAGETEVARPISIASFAVA